MNWSSAKRQFLLFVLGVLVSAVWTPGQQIRPLERANPCAAENNQLPSLPPAADEVRFVALGDTGRGCSGGNGDEQCRVSTQMFSTQKATGFDLMLLLGDNVYESGKPKDFPEKLYEPYRNIAAAGVLIKGVVGNHDVRSTEGTAIHMKFLESPSAADQAKFFTLPVAEQAKLPGGTRTYYSFTRGSELVEFFALDSSMLTDDCCGPFRGREYPATEKQAQIEWLRAGLRASKARWKIVLLHHPLYSSSKEHGVKVGKDGSIKVNEEMEKIRTLEPIFIENGVRLVMTAHDHVYERIKPQKGVQYLVAGAGSETREDDLVRRMPEFHHCGESRRSSFVLLAALPERIDFWAIDDAGNVFDSGSVRGN